MAAMTGLTVGRQVLGGEQPEHRIELVDAADGGDPRAVLAGAGTVAEAGGAVVAGAGCDSRQSIGHGVWTS